MEDDSKLEKLLEEVKTALSSKSGDPNGATYQSLRKLNASALFKAKRDSEAVYNLIEAIAPSVRTMAQFRSERTVCDNNKKAILEACSKKVNSINNHLNINADIKSDKLLSYLSEENSKIIKSGLNAHRTQINEKHLDRVHIRHLDDGDDERLVQTRKTLDELPKEWTVIQLTAGYEQSEQWQTMKVSKFTVKDFYVSVLKNDMLEKENVPPFTINIVPEQIKYGEKQLFVELLSTIEENLFVIDNNLRITNNSLEKYWEKRSDCDLRMKGVISTMDRSWLRYWRCLLTGQIKSDILNNLIDEFCNDFESLSSTQRFLIKKLISASHHVSKTEASLCIRRIYIEYAPSNSRDSTGCNKCNKCQSKIKVKDICVKCDSKIITGSIEYKLFKKTVLDFIDDVKSESQLKGLKIAERYPVILLIDEKLDTFPWELLPVLSVQAVTRMECLKFAHALFKKHENNIRDGYYILKPVNGNYLINPGGDLSKMEKRISSFVSYWCPHWNGVKNIKPPLDMYERSLMESDVFLYCGHGDGSQYIGGTAERLGNVKSVAVLSGCGSVRLRYQGARFLPIPIHSHFHIAKCPSVIGMLWEVTDYEVDKFTSMLLSLFLPSKTLKHWGNVDKTQWSHGIIDPDKYVGKENVKQEPDLLKAIAAARRYITYTMTASSIVARGLPIRIHPDYNI